MPKPTIVAIMKNECPYILEWVAYHHAVGVTDIVIYDNGSTDGSSELMSRLAAIGAIRHVPWPASQEVSPQVSAYKDALTHLSPDDWVVFIDADEFIVPVRHDTVPEAFAQILSRAPDATACALNWKTFGTSGQEKRDERLVMERFTRCAEAGRSPNNCVKSLALVGAIETPHIHICHMKSGSYVKEKGEPVEIYGNGMSRSVSHETLQINHYMTKSREEWDEK